MTEHSAKVIARTRVAELVRNFQRNEADCLRTIYNETQARTDFITPLLEAFGWDVHNIAGHPVALREVIEEATVEVGEERLSKRPDYELRLARQRKRPCLCFAVPDRGRCHWQSRHQYRPYHRTRKPYDRRLGCHVAPIADFSLRLVAAPAAGSPLPKAGQCSYPGNSRQMMVSYLLVLGFKSAVTNGDISISRFWLLGITRFERYKH